MASFASATLVLDGPNGSATASLTSGHLVLGRTADNDVVVPDPAASSRHCELAVEEGVLLLRDLGSSNGTLVNGQRVTIVTLNDGDVVRIGQTQGRIQVIGDDGKPMGVKTSRMPLIVVAAVVVAALAGGGTWFFLAAQARDAEHARFDAYEKKAAELLGRSPCQAVSKMQLEYLQKHDADAAQVALPKAGAWVPAERQTDEDLLANAAKRDLALTQLGSRIAESIGVQKANAEELLKVKAQLTDPALLRAVDAIDGLFAQQRQIAQDFQTGWAGYGASLKQFSTSLDGLLKADPKVAQFDPVPPAAFSPGKIMESCEASFRETKAKGLAQLAHLAP